MTELPRWMADGSGELRDNLLDLTSMASVRTCVDSMQGKNKVVRLTRHPSTSVYNNKIRTYFNFKERKEKTYIIVYYLCQTNSTLQKQNSVLKMCEFIVMLIYYVLAILLLIFL